MKEFTDFERLRPADKICEIQRTPLNFKHAQQVAPLFFRHTPTLTLPFELRQHRVFSRCKEQFNVCGLSDGFLLPTFKLRLREWIPPANEHINLRSGFEVN